MLKYGFAALCLCASSGIGFAQDVTSMFSAEQVAGVVEGMRYHFYCPEEENWHHPLTGFGNCVGGAVGGPEQASGGG